MTSYKLFLFVPVFLDTSWRWATQSNFRESLDLNCDSGTRPLRKFRPLLRFRTCSKQMGQMHMKEIFTGNVRQIKSPFPELRGKILTSGSKFVHFSQQNQERIMKGHIMEGVCNAGVGMEIQQEGNWII